MTNEEIDSMEAGPELDALVNKMVFGVVWDESLCRICGAPLFDAVEQGCTRESCSLRPAPDVALADLHPPYSTDIDAAWQILMQFEAMGYHWMLNSPFKSNKAPHFIDLCFCEIEEDPGKPWKERWRSYADTAPLAICRTVLKAVLSKQE